MLHALAFASESLLLGHWCERASSVLQHLGEATEMSRVYIFRNRLDAGRVLTTQIAEWTAAGIEPQIDNPELVDFALAEGGYGRWIEVLGRGEIVAGSVGEFPPDEQEFLAAQHILAVAVAPIQVGGRWWGFVGFDDRYKLGRGRAIAGQSRGLGLETRSRRSSAESRCPSRRG